MKDNQALLADSIRDLFVLFQATTDKTPHNVAKMVEKNHGRLEARRYHAFHQFAYRARLLDFV